MRDGRPWLELSRKEQDELSKSSFASLRVRPIAQLTPAEVFETVNSLEAWSGPSPRLKQGEVRGDPNGRAALIRLASDFLYHMFVQDDPAAYRAWRTSLGYTLVPTPFLIKGWTVPVDYETIFKEPYPGDDHFVSVFDAFWVRASATPSCRATGVCDGPGAAFVAFGQVAATNPGTWPSPRNVPGLPVWVGSTALTNRNWWSAPHGGFAAVLKRKGTLRVAVVGLILEHADGVRAPVLLEFYQDGASDTWWIRNLIVQNPPFGRDNTAVEF
ncbi:MAG: hypothetical protein IT439_08025 [Phycisphaerales bacterium]|nr:hypothetical protein [Phycisphaerales bacterium]